MTTTPTYEDFLGHQRDGKVSQFLRSLEPGVPKRIPGICGPFVAKAVTAEQRAAAVWRVSLSYNAKKQGVKVAIRSFGTEVWACRLKDEDVAL